MGENIPLDRSIGVASKVTDYMATEWTDEKHMSFLNSMEASFVKQLYSSEQSSNDLLRWLSRHNKLSRLDPKNQPIGQFKAQRRGCWERLEFKNQDENENESDELSKNHWIRHFRSHSVAKEAHRTSPDVADGSNLVGQSARVIDQMHVTEAASSTQTLQCCSHKVHKVSIGSITEVSDQNFVDVEVERGDESSRRCMKKRARYVASDRTDQVVPFVVAPSDQKTAYT